MVLDDNEITNIFNIFFHKYSYYDVNEFYDVAAIGFVKALLAFDESRGVKFSTYAISCMRSEVLTEIRKYQQIKRRVNQEVISFDSILHDNYGVTLENIYSTNDLADLANDINVYSALHAIKMVISPIEYKILCFKMFGYDDKRISIVLGVKPATVTSIQRNFKYNTKILDICYHFGIINKPKERLW